MGVIMEDDALAATALPSLLTSACLISYFYTFTPLGDRPLVQLLCFMLLPTVSALACLQDKRFLRTFKRLVLRYVVRTEDREDRDGSGSDALVAARNDLLKIIGDRWPGPRNGHSGPFSLSRYSSATGINPNIVAAGIGSSGGNSTGKSLYDQVRSHLTDHKFPKNHDAPIYFMDPTTGSFLRVNEQHKLVFTDTPDASCLFHVVKGKTHHWGFYSAIHQRYIGMNVLNKIVVNSKKMQSWESFRILQRPDRAAKGNGAGQTIYVVLCSARFGKGMWLGRRRRTAANPTDMYLTKNFAHALALVYASDLSAFEYLSQPRGSQVETQSMSDSASELAVSSSSLITSTAEDDPFGADFQAPVLQTAERSKVVLPWIDERTSRRFLELPEKQMFDVVSTTISKCTVRDFLEFFIDQDARRMCHEKTSQAPAPPPNSSGGGSRTGNSDDQRLSEWHLHPQFGFVRKLSYRPPAPSGPGNGEQKQSSSSVASMAASVAIDQYHSCSVNEKSMQKAVFRSKIFTLSIPKSNCFSVETVFELQDTQERDGMYALAPINSMVLLKCRTGVHFTRKTMFSAQIEKGVVEGVKNACDLLLKVADEYRGIQAEGRLSSTSESSTQVRSRRDAFPPHTLAVEVIKGLINAIGGNDRVGTSITRRVRSSLNVQMPWTPAALLPTPSSRSSKTASVLAYRPKIGGFFECSAQAFQCVFEEAISSSVSPSQVFDVVLSDASSFFHTPNKQVGNMEVDIGAWRTARFPVDGAPETPSFLRKQLFRMPVSGVAGLDVAQVEDYQYYALQRATTSSPQNGERLEFGMKIFARDLPDGERFSIEVVVVVDQTTGLSDAREAETPSCTIRVSYAIAKTLGGHDAEDDPLHSALVRGTVRGLKRVWTRVADVIQDAARRVARPTDPATSVCGEDVRHRLQIEGTLPRHDELTSTIIESITELY